VQQFNKPSKQSESRGSTCKENVHFFNINDETCCTDSMATRSHHWSLRRLVEDCKHVSRILSWDFREGSVRGVHFRQLMTHCADVVLLLWATGPGDPPAVWVWTRSMVGFGFKTVHKPNWLHLGRANLYLYSSSGGDSRGWLTLLGPISGSRFRVALILVIFRHHTVKCKILTLIHHCLCLLYWLSIKSQSIERRFLLYPEPECQWSVNDFSSSINSMIRATRQPHCQLELSLNLKWISLHLLLQWHHLES